MEVTSLAQPSPTGLILEIVIERVQFARVQFARDEGNEKKNFLFPSSRAPREISRSPRLAHKAPVMQATLARPFSKVRFNICTIYHTS